MRPGRSATRGRRPEPAYACCEKPGPALLCLRHRHRPGVWATQAQFTEVRGILDSSLSRPQDRMIDLRNQRCAASALLCTRLATSLGRTRHPRFAIGVIVYRASDEQCHCAFVAAAKSFRTGPVHGDEPGPNSSAPPSGAPLGLSRGARALSTSPSAPWSASG